MISVKSVITCIAAAAVVGSAGFAYAQVELQRSPAVTTEHDVEATGAMRSSRRAPKPIVITERETVIIAAPAPAPAATETVVIVAAADTPPAYVAPAEPMAKADRN